MFRLHFTLVLFVVFQLPLQAQKKNEAFKIFIKPTSSSIQVDGVMNEAAWLEADVAKDFYMVLPMDTSAAKVKTEVRMTYDQKNLYIIATCFHLLPGRYYVESLRRDFAFS